MAEEEQQVNRHAFKGRYFVALSAVLSFSSAITTQWALDNNKLVLVVWFGFVAGTSAVLAIATFINSMDTARGRPWF